MYRADEIQITNLNIKKLLNTRPSTKKKYINTNLIMANNYVTITDTYIIMKYQIKCIFKLTFILFSLDS